jgi:ankyrin repeat protein
MAVIANLKIRSKVGLMASAIVAMALYTSVAIAGATEDLIEAAKHGDLPSVNRLLKKDVNSNARDKEGTTPLVSASMKGHCEIAPMLLAKEADANEKNQYDTTADQQSSANVGLASSSSVQSRVLFSSAGPFHIGDEQMRDWPTLHGKCFNINFQPNQCTKILFLNLESFGLENSVARFNEKTIQFVSPQIPKEGFSRPNYWSFQQYVELPIQFMVNGMNSLEICADLVSNPEHRGDVDDFQIKNIGITALDRCD